MKSEFSLDQPGFLWTTAAALIIVLLALIPELKPLWFVEPTGNIKILGGPFIALAIALGLMLGKRWVRYLVLALLGIMALSQFFLLGTASSKFAAGYTLLAVLNLLALGILGYVPSVREFFSRHQLQVQNR